MTIAELSSCVELRQSFNKNIENLSAALNNQTKLDHVQKLPSIKTIIKFLCNDTDPRPRRNSGCTLRTHKELIFQRCTQREQ